MGRNHNELNSALSNRLILLFLCFFSCSLVYTFLSAFLTPSSVSDFSSSLSSFQVTHNVRGCCRGIENLELWGAPVKWGSEFKFNTSRGCCEACKSMCTGKDGPCLCDTWVFCGNRETCGSQFGECWLKKQKDSLAPERKDDAPPGEIVSWTSGLIFGKGEERLSDKGSENGHRYRNYISMMGWAFHSCERGKLDHLPFGAHKGIILLETEYGALHIKLFPDCAPHSVAYILELLALRHCAGCQFYRAESRGQSWDSEGNHIENAAFGPPYALIQGMLEAQGTPFKNLPIEDCPTLRRGSVAWIGSGPAFFISLANHAEWKNEYTVFGSVLPEDMHIAEKIATLPTVSDVWNNVNVTVLEKPVPLLLRRVKKSHED